MLLGGAIIGIAAAGDFESGTRIALVALGVAVFFAAAGLVSSMRREARGATRQERLEARLDELIQLEREQLEELRGLRATREVEAPPETREAETT